MKGNFMSTRSSRGTARRLAATAAAIGSAGLILGAPAAGLLAAPGVASAAPVVPAPLQGLDLGSLFGAGGLGGLSGLIPGLGGGTGGLGSFDAVFGFFNAIPIVNIF